ncbi:hypothetical protein DBIPINDM_007185 (plasmid) [Mesorhizobium sp. AR02]|uniref:hypothetical protein n=1 Tax=Mesorhizobium sp. AR02 TaxID=2865837 RepID=UPI002160D02A|nr:hypothetical protein [Mesorhizobium sp. AR02]UVK50369.1 hypothetical protein DBIPINDM_007185 [Mesorhizobium sp. AR02]
MTRTAPQSKLLLLGSCVSTESKRAPRRSMRRSKSSFSTPDRIAIAIAVLAQVEEETRQPEREWALRRDQARCEAGRAREPLVARSLERLRDHGCAPPRRSTGLRALAL